MLSILIPTYNFDCLLLIRNLYAQCEVLREAKGEFDYEIIVVDDASPDKALVKRLRDGVEALGCERIRLVVLPVNVRQAAVRNVLMRKAVGEWLLFIDSDAEVVSDDFVSRYWQHRFEGDAVVGGIVHPRTVRRGYELRIAYEKSYEKKRGLDWRKRHPYAIFTAFNLLIRREVMVRYGFDEHCREYGYEDFLLGVALERDRVRVAHIDNPLLHTGIDTSEVFLKKTEIGVRTLLSLPAELQRNVGLSRLAFRLKKCKVDGVVRCLLNVLRPVLRKQLLSARPSVFLLQLYKLGGYLNGME